MAARITFTLHELVAELDAYADGVLADRHGVSFNHFVFLATLGELQPIDMTALARCLQVTKAAVSKRVPALVEEGWIRATPDAAHGRRVLLSLTPRAHRLVEEAGGELDAEFRAMFSDPRLEGERIDVARLNRQLEVLIGLVIEKEKK